MSERVRERSPERRRPESIIVGPPSRLTKGLSIALDSVPTIYEKDIEKNAKITLSLLMYFDPSTQSWFPATSPRGTPEIVVKGYKPDTNTYEYLRIDEFYNLKTRDYFTDLLYNDVFKHIYVQLIDADETSSQSITIDLGGRSLVGVFCRATTATTFHLDVSNDNVNWFNDVVTYQSTTFVNDVIKTCFRYVRLRSDAAGSSGDKVTLVLCGKGG